MTNIKRSIFLPALCCLAVFFRGGAISAAEQLPPKLTVDTGALKIELDSRFFWNLNGVWFRGVYAGQKNGGFYGSVINYRGLGWVGTGHLENRIGEKIQELSFAGDDAIFTPRAPEISCRKFALRKKALLHQAELLYTLEVEGCQIREFAQLRFLRDAQWKVIYHFMHNWDKAFTEYRVVSRAREISSGNMPLEKAGEKLFFRSPGQAVFRSPASGVEIRSEITASDTPRQDGWLFWNRGRQDRKMYYSASTDSSAPRGTCWQWRMTTEFRETPAGENTARGKRNK